MKTVEEIFEQVVSLQEEQTMIIKVIVQGNEIIQPWFETIPREFTKAHEDHISNSISDLIMGNIGAEYPAMSSSPRPIEGPYDLYEYQISCDEHGEIIQTLYNLEYQVAP